MTTFTRKRDALLADLETWDEARLRARPHPGKWSAIEIVEHLVLAERSVFGGMRSVSELVSGERRLPHRVRYLMVLFVLKTGIPVSAPSAVMLPSGRRTLRELREMWMQNQAWLESALEHLRRGGLHRAVFEHPIAGPLTLSQAIHMGTVHLDGHTRQIRRIARPGS